MVGDREYRLELSSESAIRDVNVRFRFMRRPQVGDSRAVFCVALLIPCYLPFVGCQKTSTASSVDVRHCSGRMPERWSWTVPPAACPGHPLCSSDVYHLYAPARGEGGDETGIVRGIPANGILSPRRETRQEGCRGALHARPGPRTTPPSAGAACGATGQPLGPRQGWAPSTMLHTFLSAKNRRR